MSHTLQFLDDRINAARTDEQYGIGQPADNVLVQLLVGKELLGQESVFGLD
jgi:hypothetical protein